MKSRGNWSLVRPSTVPPPSLGREVAGVSGDGRGPHRLRYRCYRSVDTRVWQLPFQSGVRSMAFIKVLKIKQLCILVGGRPEQVRSRHSRRRVPIIRSTKQMAQWHPGHGFDFHCAQHSKGGLH